MRKPQASFRDAALMRARFPAVKRWAIVRRPYGAPGFGAIEVAPFRITLADPPLWRRRRLRFAGARLRTLREDAAGGPGGGLCGGCPCRCRGRRGRGGGRRGRR